MEHRLSLGCGEHVWPQAEGSGAVDCTGSQLWVLDASVIQREGNLETLILHQMVVREPVHREHFIVHGRIELTRVRLCGPQVSIRVVLHVHLHLVRRQSVMLTYF